MNKLDISIGVCAYNEEKNIRQLLNSIAGQKTESVAIKEIIVVSDGSTDKTDEIIKNFSWEGKTRFIRLRERTGKYAAVNEFIKNAISSVFVLASADIMLDRSAIEHLCEPFVSDQKVGMTGAHPIPVNQKDSFLGYVVNLQWYLHHKLALVWPKFGELVAFRSIIDVLPPTFVDEEQIASAILAKGYLLKYAPDAIVYNKGPRRIGEFISQRRRIYAGHAALYRDYNYKVATLGGSRVLKCFLDNLGRGYPVRITWMIGAMILESISRALGRYDLIFKKKHLKWAIAQSTKELF